MHLLLGGASGSEIVGLAPAQMVVIETDGSIEQEDTLKAAYAGAAATGLHVDRDPLDAALSLPEIVARQIGVAGAGRAVPRLPGPLGLRGRPVLPPVRRRHGFPQSLGVLPGSFRLDPSHQGPRSGRPERQPRQECGLMAATGCARRGTASLAERGAVRGARPGRRRRGRHRAARRGPAEQAPDLARARSRSWRGAAITRTTHWAWPGWSCSPKCSSGTQRPRPR